MFLQRSNRSKSFRLSQLSPIEKIFEFHTASYTTPPLFTEFQEGAQQMGPLRIGTSRETLEIMNSFFPGFRQVDGKDGDLRSTGATHQVLIQESRQLADRIFDVGQMCCKLVQCMLPGVMDYSQLFCKGS